MPIRVTSAVRLTDGSMDDMPLVISAMFDDATDFLSQLHDTIRQRQSIFDLFPGSQVQMQEDGSDIELSFYDRETNYEMNYPTLFHRVMNRNGRNEIGTPWELVIAPAGDLSNALFRYSDFGEFGRLQYQPRGGGLRGTSLSFRNDSGKIAKLRRILDDVELHPTIDMLIEADPLSWIELSNGAILKEGYIVRDYYATLTCVLFSIELYFGVSSFMTWCRGQLHETMSTTKYNKDFEGKRDRLSYSRPIYNNAIRVGGMGANRLTAKILDNLDIMCPLPNGERHLPLDPISEKELAFISLFLKIDFHVFNVAIYREAMTQFGTPFLRSCLTSQEKITGFRAKQTSIRPLALYQYRRDRLPVAENDEGDAPVLNNGTIRQTTRFGCMIFLLSDLWDENCHLEAELDVAVVSSYAQGLQGRLNPMIHNVNATGEATIAQLMAGSVSRMDSHWANYSEGREIDWGTASTRQFMDVEVWKEATDLLDWFAKVCTAIERFQEGIMAGLDRDVLFRRCIEMLGIRKIAIANGFFTDCLNSKQHFLSEPFCTQGISCMADLLGFILKRVIEEELEDKLFFEDATVGASPSSLRRLLIKDGIRKREMNEAVEISCENVDGPGDMINVQKEPILMNSGLGTFSLCLGCSGGNIEDVDNRFPRFEFRCSELSPPTSAHMVTELIKRCVRNRHDVVCGFADHVGGIIRARVEVFKRRLESEDQRERLSAEFHLQRIHELGGVRSQLVKSDLMYLLWRHQPVRSSHGKSTSADNLLRCFVSTYPASFENVIGMYPKTLEPTIMNCRADPVIDLQTPMSFNEIDCTRMYTTILQGGYVCAWSYDYYRQPLIIGPSLNPSYQQLSRATMLRSYFIDSGMCWVEGAKIDWDYLVTICPVIFSRMSSWFVQRSRCCFVDNYVIIDLCMKVVKSKGIRFEDTAQMNIMFMDIQRRGLCIKFGMFDLAEGDRKVLHRLNGYEDVPGKSFLGSRIAMFGNMVSERLSQCMVVGGAPGSHFKVRTLQGGGREAVPIAVHANDMGGEQCLVPGRNRYNRMCAHFATVNLLVYDNMDDKEVAMKELKALNNRMVGGMKFRVKNGLSVRPLVDIIPIGEEEESTGPKRLREQEEGIVDHTVFGAHAVFSPNNAYWQTYLPGCDKIVVFNTKTAINNARRGCASLRRFVLNTGRTAMDKIACIGRPVYRVATDSVLVDDARVGMVRDAIGVMSGGNGTDQHDGPIIGEMHSSTIKHVTIGFGLPYSKKYDSIVHYPNRPPKEILEMQPSIDLQMALDALKPTVVQHKDSEVLLEFYEQRHRPFDGLSRTIEECKDGIILHGMLWPYYQTNDRVKQFYNDFTEFSSKKLLEMDGCVMYGDPGSGKTRRSQRLCQLYFKQQRGDDIGSPIWARKKPVVVSSMHSILELYGDCKLGERDEEEAGEGPHMLDRLTMHAFSHCGMKSSAALNEPDKKLSLRNGSEPSRARTYGLVVCDEIETVGINFEEILKRCYERFNMKMYLVGDPLQSAPPFDKGFDMEGSTAQLISSGNRYHFNLQFRNTSVQYQAKLESTSRGHLGDYLHEHMCQYRAGQASLDAFDVQLTEIATDMLAGRPTRTISCPSYKVGACVMTEVVRRVLSMDISLRTDYDVLTYTGEIAHPKAKNDGSSVRLETTSVNGERTRMEKRNAYRVMISKRNNPTRVNILAGIPLVMKPGFAFRAMHRFKPCTREEYVGKSALHILLPETRRVRMKDDASRIQVHSLISLRGPLGKILWITREEFCMHFLYAFSIQKEFIIGSTLTSLTILQPVCPAIPFSAYNSIQSRLEREEAICGTHAVRTDLARCMRVAVTRVREMDNTFVLDFPVPSQYFWKKCLWDTSSFGLLDCVEHVQEWDSGDSYALRMRETIEEGCRRWTIKDVDQNRLGVATPDKAVRFPDDRLIPPPVYPNDSSFPLYLRT